MEARFDHRAWSLGLQPDGGGRLITVLALLMGGPSIAGGLWLIGLQPMARAVGLVFLIVFGLHLRLPTPRVELRLYASKIVILPERSLARAYHLPGGRQLTKLAIAASGDALKVLTQSSTTIALSDVRDVWRVNDRLRFLFFDRSTLELALGFTGRFDDPELDALVAGVRAAMWEYPAQDEREAVRQRLSMLSQRAEDPVD